MLLDPRREDAGLPIAARNFVHMRDAKLFTGGQEVPIPLWRGNLGDVSSWSMKHFG